MKMSQPFSHIWCFKKKTQTFQIMWSPSSKNHSGLSPLLDTQPFAETLSLVSCQPQPACWAPYSHDPAPGLVVPLTIPALCEHTPCSVWTPPPCLPPLPTSSFHPLASVKRGYLSASLPWWPRKWKPLILAWGLATGSMFAYSQALTLLSFWDLPSSPSHVALCILAVVCSHFSSFAWDFSTWFPVSQPTSMPAVSSDDINEQMTHPKC